MTSFLFWNLNRKNLVGRIKSLISKYDFEIILLCECSIKISKLITEINEEEVRYFYAPGNCERIIVLTRFSNEFISPILESNRYTIRRLSLPGCMPMTIGALHLPDMRNWSEASQDAESAIISDEISEIEKKEGHKRTILVGDFNMNPFQPGMVNAKGFHAVMCKKIAAKGDRVVQSRNYNFFYNPMWSLFGDETKGPPGTYYLSKAEHKVYFWNMLDQVLIRPDIIDRFDFEELEILTSDGNEQIVMDNGIPNKNISSDHLPLKFSISI